MADATLHLSNKFPVGTPVDVFPAAEVGEPWRGPFPKRAPHGAAVPKATAVVAADGSLSLTGLTAGDLYVATEAPVRASVVDEGEKVWTVSVTASGGTFVLLVDEEETDDIAFDASAGDVETAVQATTAGAGASVAGDAGGPWTVTLAGSEAITVDGSELTVADTRTYVQFGVGAYTAPKRPPHPYGS